MNRKLQNVLLVSQYFDPENFKGNDIAYELQKRGYRVDVLTGIPNYPQGRYLEGYGVFKKRREIINGVHVYRAFQFPRGNSTKVLMALNYFSFPFFASLYILFFLAWRRYDVVFVQQLSPIFQAFPAILLKKIKKTPLYMWVLDIWPDALRSAAGIKNDKILNSVDKFVQFTYKNCDKILISSQRFAKLVNSKNDYSKKMVYYPNWSDDILGMDDSYEIPQLPEGFKIMIAGNLGKSQNLDAVADVMLGLKDIPEVKWVFVGGGSRKEWLEEFIKENGLEDSAMCLGQYPFEAMPAFFKQADAMLVTLRAGFPHLEAVVPARLQSYMSAGRPVLAMIGCGGADIIEKSHCGYAVPAGDSKALIEVIKEKVLANREAFEKMGKNGREFYMKHFRLKDCIDNLEQIIGVDK